MFKNINSLRGKSSFKLFAFPFLLGFSMENPSSPNAALVTKSGEHAGALIPLGTIAQTKQVLKPSKVETEEWHFTKDKLKETNAKVKL